MSVVAYFVAHAFAFLVNLRSNRSDFLLPVRSALRT